MKKIRNSNFLILLGALIVASCKEEIQIATPEFEVETRAKTYKVGEEITFNFKGNPDFISFYSGQVGNDYNFKSGRVVEKGVVKLSFRSNVQYGNQADMFSIMASSNFNGDYSDISNVLAATWTDITSRFTLGSNTTFVNSGQVDISDLVVDEKPFYIGFRYKVRNSDLFGPVRTWRVQGYELISETSIGRISLGDMLTAGFQIIDQNPTGPAKTRSNVSTATITLLAASLTDENKNINTEAWAIASPVNAGKFDAGADKPTAIKGSITGYTKDYKYTFSKPGNYTAYFVVSNNNIYGVKELVRRIDLNIIP